jgi:hypothetical protein
MLSCSSALLRSSSKKLESHILFLEGKAKTLTSYISKIETVLEVREAGVVPHIWDEYVRYTTRLKMPYTAKYIIN